MMWINTLISLKIIIVPNKYFEIQIFYISFTIFFQYKYKVFFFNNYFTFTFDIHYIYIRFIYNIF